MSKIIVHDLEIHYEYFKCCADTSKGTLVFVHGLGLNLQSWGDFPIAFNNEYHILIYDCRGHGFTSWGQEEVVTWELIVEDLESLLDKLNIRNAHFIGHGIGGNFICNLAIRSSDLVESIVLISTPGYFMQDIADRVIKYRLSVTQGNEILPLANEMIRLITLKQDIYHDLLLEAYQQCSLKIYFQLLELITNNRPFEQLTRVQQPTLVLAGESDILFPPYLSVVTSNFMINSTFFVVPYASNMVFLDQPIKTAERIRDFFEFPIPKVILTSQIRQVVELRDRIAQISLIQHNTTHFIKVELLYSFRVIVNYQEIKQGWNQRNAQKLFAFLTMNTNTTRDRLIETFWPAIELKKAQNILRVSLNYLKRLLNDKDRSLLLTDRNNIILSGYVECDLSLWALSVSNAFRESVPETKFQLCKSVFLQAPDELMPGFYDDYFVDLRNKLEFQLLEIGNWLLDQKELEMNKIEYLKVQKKIQYIPSNTDKD